MVPKNNKLFIPLSSLRTLVCFETKKLASSLSLLALAILMIASVLTASFSSINPEKAEAINTSSTINFQARILTPASSLVPDGYYNVRFKIYDGGTQGGPAGTGQANTGSQLWTESYYDSNGVTAGNDNRLRVVNGYVSVNLGSQTAFSGINWDQELWITMDIGGTTQTATPTYDGEMLGSVPAANSRLKLTGVPYAFRAGQLAKTTGTYNSTLDFATQTASRNILLPDENGTVCLQSSTACGFAAATGATGYIQNGTALQTANFYVQSSAAGSVAGIVRGHASQSVDIFQVLTGAGTKTLFVDSAGNISTNSGNLSVGTTSSYGKLTVSPLTAGGVGQVIRGVASQTADLFQIQDSSGAILTAFQADGKLAFGPSGAQDTNLYRSAANTLKTDDSLIVSSANASSATGLVLEQGSGGGNLGSGRLYFSNTTSSGDEITVFSPSTNVLDFRNAATQLTASGTTRFQFDLASDRILFGSAQDTNLFRSAANTLKTDDTFAVGNNASIDAATGNITTAGAKLQGTFVDGQATNLVTNGSFETNITGWTSNALTASRSTAEAYFGSASLQLTYSGAGDGFSIGNIVYPPTSFANRPYTISFWAKASAAGTSYGSVMIQEAGPTYNALCTVGTISLTTSWQKFQKTCNVGASSATGWRVVLRPVNDSGIDTFYDGVSVTYGTSALEYSSINTTDTGNVTLYDGNLTVTNGTITGTQLISTIATGTAPLTVSSTTKVTNLNVDLLDGLDSTAFATATGGTGYIQNGTSLQTTANFNIQSAAAGSVGGVIRGATSQTADLFQLQNSAGTILAAFQADGKLVFGPSGAQDTNLYRSAANTLKTDDTFAVGNNASIDATTGGINASYERSNSNEQDSGATAGWRNIGTITGASGSRFSLRILGAAGYGQSQSNQGETVITGSLGNNTVPASANIQGTWYSLSGNAVVTSIKFVENGSRNTYDVYANFQTFSRHTVLANMHTATWTPAWATVSDPGVDSATVKLAINQFNVTSGTILGASTIQGTQLISTIATGTAPLTVSSTTKVTNLNVDLLDGLDSTAFATATGGTGYIQNGTSLQTTANFNIQSAAAGSVGGVIRGATSQTADLFQLQNSAGTILAAFQADGKLVFGPSGAQDTNLYRSAAGFLKTDSSFNVGCGNNTWKFCVSDSSANTAALINQNSTGNIFVAQDNGSAVLTIADGGSAIFRTTTDNDSAFQFQNSVGESVLIVGTVAQSSIITNLIKNPSFENGSVGWSGKGGAGNNSGSSSLVADAYSGIAVGTVTASATGHGKSYAVTLSPSTAYNFSAYIRLDSGSMSTLVLGRQDQSGTDVDCAASPTIGTAWTRVSCNFTTGGTISSSNVYIKQSDAGSRTINIDAVQLTAGSTRYNYNNGDLYFNTPISRRLIVAGYTAGTGQMFEVQDQFGQQVFGVDTDTNTAIIAGTASINGGSLTSTATTFNLLQSTVTTLNIGAGVGAGGINLAGGSGATGCTIDGSNGNLTCSGAIATTATTGTQGWWSRSGITLQPATAGDNVTTTGNISTTSTGTITSAGLLTASNGITVSNAGGKTTLQLTSTGADTGLTIGADTNLYRSAANTLKTDDNLTIQTATNSPTAFQIQNTSGQNLLIANTTDQRLAVGPAAVAANGVLTVGTNTTTASGGMYFGTDTNLYRYTGGFLATDGGMVSTGGSFYTTAAGAGLLFGDTNTSGIINALANGAGDMYFYNGSASPVLTLTQTGTALFRNSTNSTIAFQIQSASGSDTMFIADTTAGNKIKIGNSTGTGTSTTVFQLDGAASAPFGTGQTAYLGSMYYDTTQGKLQCYENRNGTAAWGACGSAPNNIITLTPEYTGAVLNGTGVGTMTADFCSNETAVLVVGTLCANHETRNFYKWTSPQGTSQTYSIYVNYKLPTTFSSFNDANTIKLTALSDNTTNASATLQVFRKNVVGNAITSCGSATTINSSSNTWQQTSFGGNETTCGFVGGDYVIFKIDVTAKSSANIYVENLDFIYSNT